MIVRTRTGGNVALRSVPEFGSSAIPLPGGGFASYSGRPVTLERASGLPAVGSVIEQVCSAVAMCDLDVFAKATATEPCRRVYGSWQEDLFENPTLDDSEFDMLFDLAAGVETAGNSFFLKTKDRLGKVLELRPLAPDFVRVRREGGVKVFDVRIPDDAGRIREATKLTSADIFHVPGFRFPGMISGVSPITRYRAALDKSLALEEFAGRFFQNDASTSFAIKVPGKLTRTQARELLDVWESTHGGLANAHRPGLLSNGADVVKLGLSMKDAQFIEAEGVTTQQAAQIWRWPVDLLNGGDSADTQRLSVEQLGLRVVTFSLAHRLKRATAAMKADHDLFPMKSGLEPRFTTNALVILDAVAQAQVNHYEIQDGTKNPNEVRNEKGLPPRPGGDDYVVTAVGAAAPPQDPSGTLEKPN